MLSNQLFSFQLVNLFDVLIVALLIYLILVFAKQSRSTIVLYGVATYIVIVYLSRTLSLPLTREIFQILATVFLLILVVIFQRELRRFFDWIFISTRRLTSSVQPKKISSDVSFAIIKAVQEMASKKIGALIVLPGELPLEGIIEGGYFLDGRVSVPILLSIFDTTSPGHDGAVIIDHNHLKKFGVHLPLAVEYQSFDKTGTRHRAAAGITERTDALAIVVSEERGEISIAEGGKLNKITDTHLLEEKISKFIKQFQEPGVDRFWRVFLMQNWRLKIIALVLALILGLVF